MRKYLFFTLLPVSIWTTSHSQFTKESESFLYAKIDSLKKAVSSLNGKDKVDCLNSIVDQYQIMDEDNQMQIDSAGPYARQAHNYAVEIGYKRGLGYACLKLGYINLVWATVHKNDKSNPTISPFFKVASCFSFCSFNWLSLFNKLIWLVFLSSSACFL